jgi:ferredoxin
VTMPSSSAQPRPIVPGATEFEVELARSHVVLTVPAHRSLLSVIRDAVPEALSFCENGQCGTCATGVLEGEPEHRDSVLSERDRAANDVMMICVGRSKSPRLVLDM